MLKPDLVISCDNCFSWKSCFWKFCLHDTSLIHQMFVCAIKLQKLYYIPTGLGKSTELQTDWCGDVATLCAMWNECSKKLTVGLLVSKFLFCTHYLKTLCSSRGQFHIKMTSSLLYWDLFKFCQTFYQCDLKTTKLKKKTINKQYASFGWQGVEMCLDFCLGTLFVPRGEQFFWELWGTDHV